MVRRTRRARSTTVVRRIGILRTAPDMEACPMSDISDDFMTAAKAWWVFILAGVCWLVFAFVLLSFTITTVWTVAVFAGIGFLMGGVVELFVASQVDSWRWLHVVFGIFAIIAGVVAFVWPGETFLVLAAIFAWYLLFAGVLDIVIAFVSHDEHRYWWLQLVLGIAEVMVGFWAVGYAGRSVVLLVIWLAAAAIARGIGNFALGFGLHKERKRASGGDMTGTGPTPAIA